MSYEAPGEVRSEVRSEGARDQVHAHRLALGRLIHDHFDVVWRTARRLGAPEARVDDVAQEVFLVAGRKLHLIQEGRERQFLLGVTARVTASWRRARFLRSEVGTETSLLEHADPTPRPDELLERKRLRELLDAALAVLTEEQREVLVLVEIEGMTGPEAARALGVPVGTIASRLRRARDLFRAAIERIQARMRSSGEPRSGPGRTSWLPDGDGVRVLSGRAP